MRFSGLHLRIFLALLLQSDYVSEKGTNISDYCLQLTLNFLHVIIYQQKTRAKDEMQWRIYTEPDGSPYGPFFDWWLVIVMPLDQLELVQYPSANLSKILDLTLHTEPVS